jgi:hypothetical protein
MVKKFLRTDLLFEFISLSLQCDGHREGLSRRACHGCGPVLQVGGDEMTETLHLPGKRGVMGLKFRQIVGKQWYSGKMPD